MTDQELVEKLLELFEEQIDRKTWEEEWDAVPPILDVDSVDDFKDVGMLAGNAGLVLSLEDGSEFQLQIVRSN